jgi:hypothetical protein
MAGPPLLDRSNLDVLDCTLDSAAARADDRAPARGCSTCEQDAADIRLGRGSAVVGPSAIFPALDEYGRPMTSHSPVSSASRPPTGSSIGMTRPDRQYRLARRA